eukprot:30352-Pelagococcus_subviridis.AAC.1
MRSRRRSFATFTRVDKPRSVDKFPSSTSATTHSPRPFLSCAATFRSVSPAAPAVPPPPPPFFSTRHGHDGRHSSCGRQFDECLLSCARFSIAAVARSRRMPPSAAPVNLDLPALDVKHERGEQDDGDEREVPPNDERERRAQEEPGEA